MGHGKYERRTNNVYGTQVSQKTVDRVWQHLSLPGKIDDHTSQMIVDLGLSYASICRAIAVLASEGKIKSFKQSGLWRKHNWGGRELLEPYPEPEHVYASHWTGE